MPPRHANDFPARSSRENAARFGRETSVSRAVPAAPETKPARPERAARLHLLILSAVSFLLYARTLWNGWVTDDQLEVLQDHLIRSFANVPRLFTTGVWFFAGVTAENYYRPLKLLAYTVEYHLFGFHPASWHLANILFNLAVVIAIYLLVRDLASPTLAFWTALIFAFHPIHVEAVAWIAAGSDLLCALALLLAIWLYHRALHRTVQGRARLSREEGAQGPSHSAGAGFKPAPAAFLLYGGSVVLFFAALLFKETALTFPAVILAYDYFYRQETVGEILRGWRRYFAYFAVLAAYLALRVHALGSLAPATSGIPLTWSEMVLSVPVLAMKYLWLALVPAHLNYWHIYRPVRAVGWQPVAAIVAVLFLLAAMFRLRPRRPLLSFALAWFSLTLIPVLDIPKVSGNVFTDRYLYIPSFAFCLLAGWAWLWLRDRARASPAEARAGGTAGDEPNLLRRAAAYAALLALLGFYATTTLRRLPDWNDTFALISKTSRQSPDSPYVIATLGNLYLGRGELNRALLEARRAVQLAPRDPFIHNGLANVLAALGRTGEALEEMHTALQLDPANAFVHNNLSAMLLALGRDEEALAEVRKAIQLQPGFGPFWVNLGAAYNAGRQWEKAEEACRHGLTTDPDDSALFDQLGLALVNQGRGAQALDAWRRAIRLQPGDLDARVNLATYLLQIGKLDDAQAELDAGLAASPNAPNAYLAHYKLGFIYERKGLRQAAASEYERALAMKPDFAPARAELSLVRSRLGKAEP
jgi:protein O-mannosyl-transferase